jgi:serine/threonine protein kinase
LFLQLTTSLIHYTTTKGNVGTIEFMAPEMIATNTGEQLLYTEKVDIWSLGMVLFELVSLDIPYRVTALRSFELPDHIATGLRPVLPRAVISLAVDVLY